MKWKCSGTHNSYLFYENSLITETFIAPNTQWKTKYKTIPISSSFGYRKPIRAVGVCVKQYNFMFLRPSPVVKCVFFLYVSKARSLSSEFFFCNNTTDFLIMYSKELYVPLYLRLHDCYEPESEAFIYKNNDNLSVTAISANKRKSELQRASLVNNNRHPNIPTHFAKWLYFRITKFIEPIRRYPTWNESCRRLHVLRPHHKLLALRKIHICHSSLANLPLWTNFIVCILHRVLGGAFFEQRGKRWVKCECGRKSLNGFRCSHQISTARERFGENGKRQRTL